MVWGVLLLCHRGLVRTRYLACISMCVVLCDRNDSAQAFKQVLFTLT